MKKYKLKLEIKVLVGTTVIIMMFCMAIKNINKQAKECDSSHGYVCSYCEVVEYARSK